jgi:alginate O-acetyltransferase complex protein AlgI
MIFSIMMNYRIGMLIGGGGYSDNGRRLFLIIGITINLLFLFLFKYLGFIEYILNAIIRYTHFSTFQFEIINVALPIGISFYTFQSISYLVDIYKNPAFVQKNILNLGLYISFFPQLIAGPIVRYHDINMQIDKRKIDLDLFARGVERFIIGLSKKVLIANTMAGVVDGLLGSYALIPFPYSFLCVVSYTLQIYYDFSGYSDMAIGLGKMFGFNILENFNYPYASRSVTEFWRRWHISLSSWFRDYLYIPLGGNRKGKLRMIVNLFIVFFVTGLWHGAEFHFILWGLLHGMFLFVEKLFGGKIRSFIKSKIIKCILGHIYTMTTVLLLWIFFRLGIKDSLRFIKNIFINVPPTPELLLLVDIHFYIFLLFGILFAFPWWKGIRVKLSRLIISFKYILLSFLFILSFCVLATNAYNPFIYFRF